MTTFYILLNYVFHFLVATALAIIIPVPDVFKGLIWILTMLLLNGMFFGTEWIDYARSQSPIPGPLRSMGRTIMLTGVVMLVFRNFGNRGNNNRHGSGGHHTTGGGGSRRQGGGRGYRK